MSKFVGIIIGGIELVAGIVLEFVPGGQAVGALLIKLGIGTLITSAGTLLMGALSSAFGGLGGSGVGGGYSTATRNPVAPRNVIYGRSVVGGTIVFLQEFGDENKYLDMVVVLACHPCDAVESLLFDKQLVQMETSRGPFTGIGDSFSPTQVTISIAAISRLDGVVTVTTQSSGGDIPLLTDGDLIDIGGITATSGITLNGRYRVSNVTHYPTTPSHCTFQYICGGTNTTLGSGGHVATLWPDYGNKIHMEVLLGNHTDTFTGMLSGTANDGDTGDLIVNPRNPWTEEHRLLGCTSVFLRLHYNEVFSNGLPQISFLVRGKNDILDPRTSPPSRGYTENAALCIADQINHPVWGFDAAYGTEIPYPQLIAAANTCDETMPLASGATEPRYTCNGKFDLSVRPGEVLQNMLTSCAGRLTYQGGQFVIWPAAWNGASPAATPGMGAMTGGFRWKSTVGSRDLFNGVKGSYVSPANNWQASDIPPYAADIAHGYTSDAFLAEDGGTRRWLDVQLPFTISPATAQRLCKIELMRRRFQGTGTWRYNMAGYSITALDIIQMTLPFMGWTNKLLEVTAHRFTLDKQSVNGTEVTLLGTEIDVQETDSSIYDWDPSEELTPQGYQQPTMPNAFTPAPPTGLTLISDSSTVAIVKGVRSDVIVAEWVAPLDGYVLNGGHIEIRYQLAPDTVTTGTVSINTSGDATFSSSVLASQMEGGVLVIGGQTFAIDSVITATTGTVTPNPTVAITSATFTLTPVSTLWTGLPSVNPSVTQVVIGNVVDGLRYIVAIRAVNTASVSSAWVSASAVASGVSDGPAPWFPGGESALVATDPLYADRASFRFAIEYVSDAAGNPAPQQDIFGYPPANVVSAICAAPVVSPVVTSATTGGTIPAGSYPVEIVAIDNQTPAKLSARSFTVTAVVPAGTSTNTFTIHIDSWDANSTGFLAYIKIGDHPMGGTFAITPLTGTPSSITFTDLYGATSGPPDTQADHLHIQATEEVAGWRWILPVTSVSGSGLVLTFAGQAMTTNEFQGCLLSLMGQAVTGPGVFQPIVDLPISSNTATTVTLPTSVTGKILPGDFVACRLKLSTHTATQFGDSGIINTVATAQGFPSGYPVNAYAGNYAYVVGGTGQGQFAVVATNSASVFTHKGWSRGIAIDATSIVVVLNQAFDPDFPTPPFTNDGNGLFFLVPKVASAVLPNYSGKVVFTRVLSESVDNIVGDDRWAPFREVFIAGQGSSRSTSAVEGQNTLAIVSGHATPDLSLGLNIYLTLTQDVIINQPINIPGPITFSLFVTQDATGGWAITFDSTYYVKMNTTPVLITDPGVQYVFTLTTQTAGTVTESAMVAGPNK